MTLIEKIKEIENKLMQACRKKLSFSYRNWENMAFCHSIISLDDDEFNMNFDFGEEIISFKLSEVEHHDSEYFLNQVIEEQNKYLLKMQKRTEEIKEKERERELTLLKELLEKYPDSK